LYIPAFVFISGSILYVLVPSLYFINGGRAFFFYSNVDNLIGRFSLSSYEGSMNYCFIPEDTLRFSIIDLKKGASLIILILRLKLIIPY
jgi:hypothetical protein